MGQTFKDLSFNSCAVTQRSHRAPDRIQQIAERRNVTAYVDVSTMQLGDLFRHRGAGDQEFVFGHRRQERQDRFSEMYHRVDIRRMPITAEEGESSALFKGDGRWAWFDSPEHDLDRGIWQKFAEQIGFGGGIDDDAID